MGEQRHRAVRALQGRDGGLRNVCILAHVDHGKTTLSDSLIASNGLIHPKMAGQMRFLDWKEEEQARGITMKSSCISLLHAPAASGTGAAQLVSRSAAPEAALAEVCRHGHLVNLIDSPGHVDFCSEVSSAARLADGALVVVDAVEGVCVQTHAVLRQALCERVKPCLVLNKLDRLITEQQLDTAEAYRRLTQIVNDVNNIISEYVSELDIRKQDALEAGAGAGGGGGPIEDADVEEFSPSLGNVVFASAIDGWGFDVRRFAKLYAAKMGAKEQALQKALWGDYYFDGKAKKILKNAHAKGRKTMCEQMVLDPLWQVYEAVDREDCPEYLGKMARKLGLAVPARDLEQANRRSAVKALVSSWLPLAGAILDMVVQHVPDPVSVAPQRIACLVPPSLGGPGHDWAARRGLTFGKGDADVILFVSKMISMPSRLLPGGGATGDDEEAILAFGRVFAGTVREGSELHVLGTGTATGGGVPVGRVSGLYLMMGRDLEALAEAPAGSIVAVAGFEEYVHRSATLVSDPDLPALAPMTFQAAPIMRVAVEPVHPPELPQLEAGLKRLHRVDPFVEIEVSPEGENIVCAAGEVHMEQCLKDLRERFAKIDIQASPPLVKFHESVAEVRGAGVAVRASTPTGICTVSVTLRALDGALTDALAKNSAKVVRLTETAGRGPGKGEAGEDALRGLLDLPADDDGGLALLLGSLWCFGPDYKGPNMLLTGELSHPAAGAVGLGRPLLGARGAEEDAEAPLGQLQALTEAAVLGGFQLASSSGPLCEEPLWGLAFRVDVAFGVEGLKGADALTAAVGASEESHGPFSGQILACVKDACRKAVMENAPRLVQAVFKCEVLTTAEGLSGTYAALGRRKGTVLGEDMREGSNIFIVTANLPVNESFGFTDELRRRSGGASSASLVFSHLERVDEDPFFVPTTEEEREEHGEGAELHNSTRKLIDSIRKRKGLFVQEKIVVAAEKQRTRARAR